MLGKCKICQDVFEDRSKNHSRKICGSINCRRTMMKSYMKTTDPVKRKISSLKFQNANPNYLKEWREENQEQDRKLNREYVAKRYNVDVCFRLAHLLRTRLRKCALAVGVSGPRELGCSIEEFRRHLESQFTEGMSWDNYGLLGWHIDHKVPLDSAVSEEEVKRLCHYTNLQPLWALDNWKKGNKNGTL